MRFLLHVKCFFRSSQKTRDWEQLLLSFTSGYAEDLCPASGWAQKIGCQCCFCWFFSYYSWDWEAPIGCSSGLLRLPREDSEIQVKIQGSFGSSFELLLQVDSWKKSFVTLHQMAKWRLNSHKTVLIYLFTDSLWAQNICFRELFEWIELVPNRYWHSLLFMDQVWED